MSATTKNNLSTSVKSILHEDQLRDTQNIAIDYIYENHNGILPLWMGTGKTVITLTAIKDLIEYKEVKRVLIFAPPRVVQNVWKQELEKWLHLHGLTINLCFGELRKRAKAVETLCDILVVNYDNMSWFFNTYKSKHGFDMIVLDELSKMKSPKANRFKDYIKYYNSFKRHIGLTGTFTSNGLLDLYAQVKCIDRDIFPAHTKWRQQYFMPVDPDGFKWVPLFGTLEKLTGIIKPLVLDLDQSEYLDELPEVVNNIVAVKMPHESQLKYEAFKRDLIYKLEDGGVLLADNMAALTMKLQQVAQGFMYTDNDVEYIHNVKFVALNDIIDEAQGAPVMVVYKFIEELEYLKLKYKNKNFDYIGGSNAARNENVIDRWNKKQLDIMAIHPKSGGHGLNLQDGSHILVWLGLTWSLDEYQQTIARICRRGQKASHVFNHVIITENTLDLSIYEALNGKHDIQEAVMEALKS